MQNKKRALASVSKSQGTAVGSGEQTLSTPATRPTALIGTVINSAGGMYVVDVTHCAEKTDVVTRESVVCSLRGLLKKGKREHSQPVSVGDRVALQKTESTGMDARGRHTTEGFIEEVLPRKSILARSRQNKTAQVTMANLEQVVVVMSMREPDLNTHRLDRFLVLAEASDLHPLICLNKIDLLNKKERASEIRRLTEIYSVLGYDVVAVSAETDDGIPMLREMLKDKISAVLGSSGVGKSSVINAIQPGLHLWVGDVMDIGKGRHTTTDVSLHPLSFGGYLADTPGIKTVSLLDRDELNLAMCFPEFAQVTDNCRFNNCRHNSEPGCAVRVAAENGSIAASRYASYSKMLNEKTGAE